MVVHQIFAFILGEDIKNIVVCDNYELANQLSRAMLGNEAFAEDCTQYPVSIGDKFLGKRFVFKDGVTLVPRMNSAEEDAREVQSKIVALNEQQAELSVDTDYRLSLLELGLN